MRSIVRPKLFQRFWRSGADADAATRSKESRSLPFDQDPWTPQLLEAGLDPIRFLEELVAIDSVTSNIAGVNLVQNILGEQLTRLGFTLNWIDNPRGSAASGRLLDARLAPEGSEREPIRWINFVSHADTVLGLEHLGPFEVLAGGRVARGSGVIDNKGGLVVAILGIALFLRQQSTLGPREFGLRFISSPNEEAGSVGFNDMFRSYGKDAVMALGFEPALDNGNIIRSRRGNRWYRISVKGIEAHAGRSRGEHVNAAHELAIKIAKFHALNDPKNDIAVNVGRIEGGHDRFNVICGFAEAKLDTRFSTFKGRDLLHDRLEKILNRSTVFNRDRSVGAETSYEICDDCPPFSSTRRSRTLVKELLTIIQDIEGQSIEAEMAGGAGDVNYMSDRANIVIDGLGPVGGRMHTEDEFIWLPSLSSRALALGRFLSLIETKKMRRALDLP